GTAPLWQTWLYRALTFLVISCPCALVISIPLTFFAGIGGASRNGILVKGSNYLETLSKVKTVVVDKTGTLTHGTVEVSAIHHSKMEEEELIEYAALAECASSHPISKSLQNANNKEVDRNRVKDIQELSGMGIIANVDGKSVAVGNKKLMDHLQVEYKECHKAGTIIHIAIDNEYAGHIVISDKIKKNSKEALSQLKKLGIEKTVILTGDGKKTADDVASELGVDQVFSELLPSDKVTKIEEIIEEQKALKNGGCTAFCGDGINDAPVISRSDVGIAMGAIGSDAAIEAADIVIMDDDPLKIAKAIKISKHSLRIVRQNITFSIGIKAACLLLGALGIANMWIAIFADVGVMILAVLNAIRALKVS
ncbi:MAG: cadmium-translocating P-type ATPase, partial [Treponema sp.]|nr:cadmium-translocating P-type ATPase [Treponema sp.]